MNEMIQKQLNHRTIRFFKDRPVDAEQLQLVLDVMNRTATSNGLQGYSVIRVSDSDKKAKIAEVCRQPYVAQLPELFIFLVDSYRNYAIATAKGYAGEAYRSMDFFFQGAADVYLAAQNMTNALESMDMGSVFLGSILNDSQAIIDILELPQLTFPLLGLGFGYPDDAPELKPRMPLVIKVGENQYPSFNNILEELSEYDDTMTKYYDTRFKNQRSDTFTEQVVKRFQSAPELRAKMMQVVQKQGFDLKLSE